MSKTKQDRNAVKRRLRANDVQKRLRAFRAKQAALGRVRWEIYVTREEQTLIKALLKQRRGLDKV